MVTTDGQEATVVLMAGCDCGGDKNTFLALFLSSPGCQEKGYHAIDWWWTRHSSTGNRVILWILWIIMDPVVNAILEEAGDTVARCALSFPLRSVGQNVNELVCALVSVCVHRRL
jgi:hypothetical protein